MPPNDYLAVIMSFPGILYEVFDIYFTRNLGPLFFTLRLMYILPYSLFFVPYFLFPCLWLLTQDSRLKTPDSLQIRCTKPQPLQPSFNFRATGKKIP